MAALVVIPARFASTRFPGKPLALLRGRPMIQHVYENSLGARSATDVVVATDDERIFETVLAFGGKAVMTSADHLSGTDRIAEVARRLNYDIIVNVQGDEPLIRPEMIEDVIAVLEDERVSIGTLAIRIRNPRDVFDPNVVKTVFDDEGFAFYFSRAPIPYHRDRFSAAFMNQCSDGACFSYGLADSGDPGPVLYKHVGMYSYRKDVLLKLAGLPPSRLELIEKLEQLRALENRMRIMVRETRHETFGVDTPADLERIEQCLSTSS